MTKKQIGDYNRMLSALREIAKYQSPEHIEKNSFKDWGLDADEALAMAYENIQEAARFAVKGVRRIEVKAS